MSVQTSITSFFSVKPAQPKPPTIQTSIKSFFKTKPSSVPRPDSPTLGTEGRKPDISDSMITPPASPTSIEKEVNVDFGTNSGVEYVVTSITKSLNLSDEALGDVQETKVSETSGVLEQVKPECQDEKVSQEEVAEVVEPAAEEDESDVEEIPREEFFELTEHVFEKDVASDVEEIPRENLGEVIESVKEDVESVKESVESDVEEIPREDIAEVIQSVKEEVESDVEEIPREEFVEVSESVKVSTATEEDDEKTKIMKQVVEDVNSGGAVQLPSPETLGLKLEWLGTSTCSTEHCLKIQLEGKLDELIALREGVEKDRALAPYNPGTYLELASIDEYLGFCDIAAAESYRALLLCQSGLGTYEYDTYPTDLRHRVRAAVHRNMLSRKEFVRNPERVNDFAIHNELENLQLNAYKTIILALNGCNNFWTGCELVKEALQKYPEEPQLVQYEKNLKAAFLRRTEEMKKTAIDPTDLKWLCRHGDIYQKKYPWMNKTLFHRKATQIDAINKEDPASLWEIKPVVFGPVEKKKTGTKGDVGPLGMFAKRDIEAGEIVLVDETIAGVSDVSSSEGKHCDACHAVLVPPYMSERNIVRAKCCKQVSYCSQACHDTATGNTGFHKVLCGKNFDWVYEHHIKTKSGDAQTSWPPVLFLRMMAMVIAEKASFTHPLRHTLLSRMAANYRKLVPGELEGVPHNWNFWEAVIAPTRILMELGIDVFAEKGYSQEVIQTINWRIENNAHSGLTNLTGQEVRLTAINSKYLFINHSCKPNMYWHGTTENANMDVRWLQRPDGTIMQPGSGAVWVETAKKIKKGEELKISYIGDPMGERGDKNSSRKIQRARMAKWFDNGCGCEVCEKENAEDIV